MRNKNFITFGFLMLCAVAAVAATFPAGFTETRIAHDLRSPAALAVAPDGRVFIALQEGAVRVVKGDTLLPEPFVVVPDVDYFGERGLLGIALDPAFDSTGHVYVYYTAASPTLHNRLSRFTAEGDTAAAASEQILIDFPTLPFRGGNDPAIWHMGGGLDFGPDGKLFIAVGDHENPGEAQSLESVFGKVLRVNPDGSVPGDNPHADSLTGQARMIWAHGFRNPFTIAVQKTTGTVFANDVGAGSREEVNSVVAGGNFGWSESEGPTDLPGFENPLYDYGRSNGCSVIGGDFYAPDSVRLPAADTGKYFVTDFCGGWIRKLDPETGATEDFATGLVNPTGMKFGLDGNLYYLARNHGTGSIQAQGTAYRVTADSATVTVAGADPLAHGAGREGLLAHVDGAASLIVPVDARGIRVFDLTGRQVWEARNLKSGATLALPGDLPRGVLRYQWMR